MDDKGNLLIPSGAPLHGVLNASPVLKSTDVALLLLDRYETAYGIHNHDNDDPSRPLAVIAMHRCEDPSEGCLLYERIEQFAELKVGKYFNISFPDFMDLPSDICKKILETANRMFKVEAELAESLGNRLGNQNK